MFFWEVFIILFILKSAFAEFHISPREIFKVVNTKSSEFNDLCVSQLNYFEENLDLRVLWARKFRDSWGDFPSGVFSGNVYDFGNFDQCVNFRHYSNEVGEILGQHCTLMIPYDRDGDNALMSRFMMAKKDSEISVGIGVCFPASCDPHQVKEIADAFLKNQYNVTTSLYDQQALCSKAPQPVKFNKLQVFAIIVFGMVIAMMIFSTVYEVYCNVKDVKRNQILCSFSVYSNSKLIMTLKPLSSKEMLFLHGIRSLLIIWIVFGHTFTMTYYLGPVINSQSLYGLLKSFYSVFLFSGVLAVDTFFMLSAMLMSMSVFRQLEATNKINLPVFLLKRYFRITAPLAAGILFTLTFFQSISDGPLWSKITRSAAIGLCEKWWWTSLLYVGNYVNPGRLCFGHSWYLMVDMQLYFLSPIILYPIWMLRKRTKLAIALISAVASISVIFVFVTYMVEEFRVSFLYEKNGIKDAMVYMVSHGRLDSWMMGIFVGFIMHSIEGKVVKFPRAVVMVGWIASIFTMFVVIICQYPLQQENFMDNPLIFDATYDSLKRICWCSAMAWIILACHLTYGGIVKRFLSLSIWLPISKLSFCIYLVHLPVQVVYLASLRSPIFFSDYRAIHKFLADFSVSFFVAFAWALMFEFPTLRVISIFMAKKEK